MPNYQRPRTPKRLCSGCRIIWVQGDLCSGCRVRKHRGSTVAGAECEAPGCGVNHPRLLRRVRFQDVALVLCANHAALAGRRPLTSLVFLAELAIDPGDRRQRRERRGQLERRYQFERRQYAEPVEPDARQGERRRAG